MNIPLLRKVQAAILDEPLKFNMRMWFIRDDDSPCGTTACIAGHAIAISNHFGSLGDGLRLDIDEHKTAARKLGLKISAAAKLFYVGDWPKHIRAKYRRCRLPKSRARIAVERIEHFIKTKGVE